MRRRASIPQCDPGASYRAHRAEIDGAVARVLESGWYILGAEVEAFEREFAAYAGVRHAIGVASGTDALEIALRVCGVKAGDVVLTVSHTAVATVAAIGRCGAVPFLLDVEAGRQTLDAGRLASVLAGRGVPAELRRRFRAVVPVHLYGQPADMPAIMELARQHGLAVVEDCAQAHGAALDGRCVGAWGSAGAFSFYPTKNLGAFGDGGLIVTDDAQLAERVRLLRQYGWRERYISRVVGVNSRLDEVQAAVLRVKLSHLNRENEVRQALAAEYAQELSSTSLLLPHATAGARHAYHQYVVRTPARDALQAYLERRGVGTAIHYPVPVHRQPAYRGRVALGDSLATTEQLAAQILSLPFYAQLGSEAVATVAGHIRDWEERGRPAA